MIDAIVSDEALFLPTRHVFLSPHYDDIALSCGGTAARLSASGGTPEVALIFGDHPDPGQPMTPFAEQLHRQWGMSAAEVIAGRRAEESAASEALGTIARFLPFRDAIYRGERYLGDHQLFASPASDEADLPGEIVAALDVRDPAATRIYAPLGVGSHVDHQIAFQAGLELAARGSDVWFYEDLPYGLIAGKVETRLDAVRSRLSGFALVDVSTVWEAKIDAIMAYPSQLSTIFGQYVGIATSREAISAAMGDYARSHGNGALYERFWRAA
jgi:LmbE family N-acetylglucosaminyl deacetylase